MVSANGSFTWKFINDGHISALTANYPPILTVHHLNLSHQSLLRSHDGSWFRNRQMVWAVRQLELTVTFSIGVFTWSGEC